MVSHGSHSSSPCGWSSTIHSCAFCRCHSLWIGRLVQTKSFGVAGPEYRRSKINEKSFRSIYNSSGFFERKHHFCRQKQNTHTQRNIVIQSNGSGLSQPHTIVCVFRQIGWCWCSIVCYSAQVVVPEDWKDAFPIVSLSFLGARPLFRRYAAQYIHLGCETTHCQCIDMWWHWTFTWWKCHEQIDCYLDDDVDCHSSSGGSHIGIHM